MEHIMYNNNRLNIEAKTQKSYQGNANSGAPGSARNNYPPRGGGGNRGGNRGTYRGNPRRGGGQHRNNSPSYTGRDENFKAQKQQQQQQ